MNMKCEGENIGRRTKNCKGVSGMKCDYDICKKICKKISQGAKKNDNIPRCAGESIGLQNHRKQISPCRIYLLREHMTSRLGLVGFQSMTGTPRRTRKILIFFCGG
jgi:hypothetical protein